MIKIREVVEEIKLQVMALYSTPLLVQQLGNNPFRLFLDVVFRTLEIFLVLLSMKQWQ